MLALVLASCGGGDDGTRPAPLRGEPDAGDEQPISVPVRVSIGAGDVTVRPRRVAAFLPLRFTVANTNAAARPIEIVGVGRRSVPGLGEATLTSPGLEAGRVAIRSGLHSGAVLRVRPGG